MSNLLPQKSKLNKFQMLSQKIRSFLKRKTNTNLQEYYADNREQLLKAKESSMISEISLLEKEEAYQEQDIYKKAYFDVVARRKLRENSEATLFFMDFDNLNRANKDFGGDKERVNEFIKAILQDVTEILNFYYSSDQYIISKNGDEVMVWLENNDVEKIKKINEQVNEIVRLPLSISSGYAVNQENTFEELQEEAEKQMYGRKSEKKLRNMELLYGKDPEQRALYYLERVLDSCRIDVKDLNQAERKTLQKALKYQAEKQIENHLSEKQVQEIVYHLTTPLPEPNKMKIQQRVNQLQEEASAKYEGSEISEQLIESYVIHEMLSKSETGILKKEYFEKIQSQKEPEYQQWNTLKEKEVVFIEVSGVKWVNDHKGHDYCDQQMAKLVEQLKEIIENSNLKGNTSLIENRFSNYYVLVNAKDKEMIPALEQQIQQIQTQFNVTCTSTNLVGDQDRKQEIKREAKESGKTILECLMNGVREQHQKEIEKQSTSNKVQGENASFQNYIEEFVRQILQDINIQAYIAHRIKETNKSREDVVKEFITGIINKIVPEKEVIPKQDLEADKAKEIMEQNNEKIKKPKEIRRKPTEMKNNQNLKSSGYFLVSFFFFI